MDILGIHFQPGLPQHSFRQECMRKTMLRTGTIMKLWREIAINYSLTASPLTVTMNHASNIKTNIVTSFLSIFVPLRFPVPYPLFGISLGSICRIPYQLLPGEWHFLLRLLRIERRLAIRSQSCRTCDRFQEFQDVPLLWWQGIVMKLCIFVVVCFS